MLEMGLIVLKPGFILEHINYRYVRNIDNARIAATFVHVELTFDLLLFLELNKNPVEGFSAGLIDDNDIYRWEVLIIGPPDTL